MKVRKNDFKQFPKIKCMNLSEMKEKQICIEALRGKGCIYIKAVVEDESYKIIMTSEDYKTKLSGGKISNASLDWLTYDGYWASAHRKVFNADQSWDVVSEFTGLTKGSILDIINSYQDGIRKIKLDKKHKKEAERVNNLMSQVKEYDLDKHKEYINDHLLNNYAVFKRDSKRKAYDVYCTRCGETFKAARMKHNNKELIINHSCAIHAPNLIQKAKGLFRWAYDDEVVNAIQLIGDKCLIRTFKVARFFAKENGTDVDNMQWSAHELLRTFVYPNGRIEQYDRRACTNQGITVWYKKTRYWNINYEILKDDTKEVLKGSPFQYSCLEIVIKNKTFGIIDPASYLSSYIKNPALEILIKQGYTTIAKEVTYRKESVINTHATKITDILNVDKEFLNRKKNYRQVLDGYEIKIRKDLTERGIYDYDLYEACVKGYNFKLYQVTQIADERELNLKKLLRYFINARNINIRDYRDYLDAAELLGKDMSKKLVLYPHYRKFKKLHDEYTEKAIAIRDEKNDQFVTDRWLELNWLEYKGDKFHIKIPRNTDAIKAEGKHLQHCVASYIDKHINNKCIIALLRENNNGHYPFYTIELNPENYEIRQCRGRKNCGMTDEVKLFMEEWKRQITEAISNAA